MRLCDLISMNCGVGRPLTKQIRVVETEKKMRVTVRAAWAIYGPLAVR